MEWTDGGWERVKIAVMLSLGRNQIKLEHTINLVDLMIFFLQLYAGNKSAIIIW